MLHLLEWESHDCWLSLLFCHSHSTLQSFFTHIFNGCYAVLLFIVVVFFLIYGVEVYFKVGNSCCISHHSADWFLFDLNRFIYWFLGFITIFFILQQFTVVLVQNLSKLHLRLISYRKRNIYICLWIIPWALSVLLLLIRNFDSCNYILFSAK